MDSEAQPPAQSQSCMACLNGCLTIVDAEENENSHKTEGRENGNETDNLLEERSVVDKPRPHQNYGVLCCCFDMVKMWFDCFNEGQGSSLLSLGYFLLVLAASVGLTFAHTSSYNEPGQDKVCNVTARQSHLEGFIAFLIFVSLVGIIVCVCCPGHCVGGCCTAGSNRPDYMLIGTIIFGLFSTTWFILRWFIEETCKSHHINKVDIMYVVVEIIFIMSVVYFLYSHSNVKFNKGCLMEMFFMHVIATNFCVWFHITVGEAIERANELPDICHEVVFEKECINNSYFNKSTSNDQINLRQFAEVSSAKKNDSGRTYTIVEEAIPFFYPCIAEFCLSASGLLFKMWMFPATNLGDQRRNEAQARCFSTCCNQCDVHEEQQQNHAVPTSRLNRLILSAPIFVALLACLSVVCIILNIAYRGNELVAALVYDVSQLVTIVFALIAAIVGISSFAKTGKDPREAMPETERPIPEDEHPEDKGPIRVNEHPVPENENPRPGTEHAREVVVESALLMISLAGMFIAQALELAASLDTDYINNAINNSTQTGKCWHMLRIQTVAGFLTILTSFLQTMFIIRSLKAKSSRERVQQQQGRHGAQRKRLYLLHLRHVAARVLLICNLTLWVAKTYELSGLYCNPLYYHFYGSWIQLSNIFYPLWIFFHFHSAASCFDVVC